MLVVCGLVLLVGIAVINVVSLGSARVVAGPTGDRATGASPSSASQSPPSPVRVVGLGDSVTAGASCDCDDYVTGFGRLLARQQHVRVSTANEGQSGSTSPDLLADLSHDQGLRSRVRDADVVVITTGANDLYPALQEWRSGDCNTDCSTSEIDTMSVDLTQVLQLVRALAGTRVRIMVTGYWNVFTDGDVANREEKSGYLDWSDRVTRAANAAIGADTRRYGATYVDLYTPFKDNGEHDPTGLLADDGDHPDPAGTALISQAVLAAYDR